LDACMEHGTPNCIQILALNSAAAAGCCIPAQKPPSTCPPPSHLLQANPAPSNPTISTPHVPSVQQDERRIRTLMLLWGCSAVHRCRLAEAGAAMCMLCPIHLNHQAVVFQDNVNGLLHPWQHSKLLHSQAACLHALQHLYCCPVGLAQPSLPAAACAAASVVNSASQSSLLPLAHCFDLHEAHALLVATEQLEPGLLCAAHAAGRRWLSISG